MIYAANDYRALRSFRDCLNVLKCANIPNTIGVDLGLLMEVSAAVFILVARQQFKSTVMVIRRSLVSAKPALLRAFKRGTRRVRCAARALLPPKSSDEDGLAGVPA